MVFSYSCLPALPKFEDSLLNSSYNYCVTNITCNVNDRYILKVLYHVFTLSILWLREDLCHLLMLMGWPSKSYLLFSQMSVVVKCLLLVWFNCHILHFSVKGENKQKEGGRNKLQRIGFIICSFTIQVGIRNNYWSV